MVNLIEGGIYECENGDIVKVRRNHLPYYCFSAIYIQYAGDIAHESCSETWTAEGVAYHNDCGYNITRLIFEGI